MSQSTTVSPSAAAFVSAKVTKAVQIVVAALQKADAAMDSLRQIAKSECLANKISDKKPLTALLLTAGLDASRASEVAGFVFPASEGARKELDKALAINLAAKQPKDRIAKPIVLALQRDKTGTLTLEAAKAAHVPQRSPRLPGDATPTATPTPTKPKTPKEIEEGYYNTLSAMAKDARENGYDEEDFAQTLAEWSGRYLSELFPKEKKE